MEPDQIAAMKQDLADAKALIRKLEKDKDEREAENAKARERIRALEAEKGNLEALLPGDDSVVLTGDDAKAWEAYRELGKPDLLKVKLDDYDRATTRAAELETERLVDKAARDPNDETRYRFKPSVLQKVLGIGEAKLVAGKDGYTVKAGDNEKPLEKWLEEDQSDLLSALQITPAGTPAVRQPGDRRTVPQLTEAQLVERKRASGDYNL